MSSSNVNKGPEFGYLNFILIAFILCLCCWLLVSLLVCICTDKIQSQLSSGKYLQYIHFKSRIKIYDNEMVSSHETSSQPLSLCHNKQCFPVERLGPLISDLRVCTCKRACLMSPVSHEVVSLKQRRSIGVIAVIWHRGCTDCPPIKVLPQPSSALNVIREDIHKQIHIHSSPSCHKSKQPNKNVNFY